MFNNFAHTAVLALAVLGVTAATPASAQTFQERWSPIPKANAAEQPREQDQTSPSINHQGRSQQQIATPPERSYRQAHVLQQQRSAPVPQHTIHSRGVIVGKASFYAYTGARLLAADCFTAPS